MDLFLNSKLQFEKSAAEVTLPEDPNTWPTELLQELHKQVPYIADFDPEVVMDRVDAERGYGFGHVEIGNKSEVQAPAGSPQAKMIGVRHARIPVVIRDGKLQPFDVIITDQSKMLPLTEKRLRQSLFRPQVFDVTSRTPGDMSMISQLYPPYRQNYGFGGGGAVMTAGMGKEGEKKCEKCGCSMEKCSCGGKCASILRAVLPTIHGGDFAACVDQLSDPEVKLAYQNNEFALAPLQVLRDYKERSNVHPADKIASSLLPSVVQVRHLPGEGYEVKVASHLMWAPSSRVLDRGQVLAAAGAEVIKLADESGSVTMVEGSLPPTNPEAEEPELVKEFGIYKVKDQNGRELIGFCFPNLLDVDGSPMPATLFTNGTVSAVQGEIFGVKVAEGAALMEGHPRGSGVFYRVLPNGKAEATLPLTVTGRFSEAGGGPTFVAETMGGMQVPVVVQPGLRGIVHNGQTMMVPDSFRWMPLDKSESIALASSAEEFAKVAKALGFAGEVEVRSAGNNSFSIRGWPVEKVAHDQREFADTDQALFILGGLGVHPNMAIQKLGEAIHRQMPVTVKVARAIQDKGEVWAQAMKKSASCFNAGSLRRWLVKEAAILPDPESVDAVLSLGFINPENVLTFVGYLPQLEETQSRLCELLVASRIGQRDLPAPAIERTIRGLEETLEGLKTISFQNN